MGGANPGSRTLQVPGYLLGESMLVFFTGTTPHWACWYNCWSQVTRLLSHPRLSSLDRRAGQPSLAPTHGVLTVCARWTGNTEYWPGQPLPQFEQGQCEGLPVGSFCTDQAASRTFPPTWRVILVRVPPSGTVVKKNTKKHIPKMYKDVGKAMPRKHSNKVWGSEGHCYILWWTRHQLCPTEWHTLKVNLGI